MIAWQVPAAFIGLIALAGPVVIHLLQRQRAARLPFPSDRFVRPSATGAVRLLWPADMLLLALRLGILAAAVCALAQPVMLSPWRLQTWNARTTRAIVVDITDSMSAVAGAASAAADDELRSAATAVRIETVDLADGIHRAAARLADAAPARREIVVISDFQEGALSEPSIAAIPSSIGVRLVRVGRPAAHRSVTGPPLLGHDGYAYHPEVTVESDRTSVAFVKAASGSGGLRVVTPNEADRADLLRVVSSSGAPGPSREQPIVVTFDSGQHAAAKVLGSRWMLDAALRLRHDPELSRLTRDGSIVRAGASGDALGIDVAAGPLSYEAAAVVRGALTARAGDSSRMFSEQEVRTISDTDLRKWAREAPPVDSTVWRYAEEDDARWFWGVALFLLALETVVRARVRL